MDAQILDCTIRDGSCEVEFQFTAQDVAILAAGLDQAGIAFIEAGHGFVMGTNAIAKQLLPQVGCDMTAALDDEEYFKAIRPVVKNAKLGALFGPGYMGLGMEWIDMAADCGLEFMRIGTFANNGTLGIQREELKAGIRHAKNRGMLVCIQLMQTYAQSLEVAGDAARKMVDCGADIIYVVDSAGTMTPDEVARYVEAIRRRVDARVGFHSHNNTQTALSNCLAAIDAGATLVDGSLQGVGRATGNAPTEGLLALLQNRRNMERHVDQDLIFNLGRNYARRWVKGGFDPSHVLSGIGKVHSDRLHSVRKAAKAKGLRLDEVLVEAGRYFEQQDLTQRWTDETAAAACAKVAERGKPQRRSLESSALVSSLAASDSGLTDLAAVLKQQKVHAIRDRLKTMLVFARPSLWPLAGPSIVLRGGWAIAAVPSERVDLSSCDHEWLHEICVDDQLPRAESTLSTRSFSLSSLLADAATTRSRGAASLVACDDEELARDLSGRLWRGGCSVVEKGQPVPKGAFSAVYLQGKSGSKLLDSPELRAQLRPGTIVHVLGSEPLTAAQMQSLSQVDLRLPDVWSALVTFATLEESAAVVDGASAAAVPKGGGSYQIVAESGEVLDWSTTAVMGRWAPFASKAVGDRLSIRAIRDLYEERIRRIFSNPLDE